MELVDFRRRSDCSPVTVVKQLRAYMLVVRAGERRVEITKVVDQPGLFGRLESLPRPTEPARGLLVRSTSALAEEVVLKLSMVDCSGGGTM